MKKDRDYDLGILISNTSIDSKTGYFGINTTDTLIINKTVNLAGLWKDINKVKSDYGKTLWYDLDMTEGQSGAPVYYYDSNNGGETAIAVNSADGFYVLVLHLLIGS